MLYVGALLIVFLLVGGAILYTIGDAIDNEDLKEGGREFGRQAAGGIGGCLASLLIIIAIFAAVATGC